MENIKKSVTTINEPTTFSRGEVMLNEKKEQNTSNIVNLTKQIIDFVEYLEKPEIKELAKNHGQFTNHIETKFEDFTLEYYSIYKMLLDEKNRSDNLEKLFNMITQISKIDEGKSNYNKEFNKVRETLAEEFLYPKFGSKENFQKAMSKTNKK
jgi:hypothetical protein